MFRLLLWDAVVEWNERQIETEAEMFVSGPNDGYLREVIVSDYSK